MKMISSVAGSFVGFRKARQGVRDGCLNILVGQVWVICRDFGIVRAIGQKVEDQRHGDPRPLNHRFAGYDPAVLDNAVVVGVFLGCHRALLLTHLYARVFKSSIILLSPGSDGVRSLSPHQVSITSHSG